MSAAAGGVLQAHLAASPAADDLTVVMYHYVRDVERSRYPRLAALGLRRFREQLLWARRHHTFVSMEQVLAALDGEEALPPRALLLTFDDAYVDHYANVFPLLDELGAQGSFFATACSTRDRELLTPNKVQLILASVDDAARVADAVVAWLERHGAAHGLHAPARYLADHARPTRFDGAEVTFVKRMLQRGLPSAPRRALLEALFARYVGVSEATIAEELYATPDQLRAMRRHGMHVGAHAVSHPWLTTLTRDEQGAELDGTLALLEELGVDARAWTLAYPYGDVDDGVVALLEARGCRAAFTIEPAVARIGHAHRLRLPRFDTNDLPPPR